MPALRTAILLGASLATAGCGGVPEDVQATLAPNEAHHRADLVLTGTVKDKHTDREGLRALAGMAGAEAQVPVRWMEYELDVVSSVPEGFHGRTAARLAYADDDLWHLSRSELALGVERRLYVVRRDGALWILGWDRAPEAVSTTGRAGEGPPPEWTGTRYFPAGAVFGDAWREYRFHRMHAQELEQFQEPVLHTRVADPAAHVYRFIWLRSFDPSIVVRLEVRADGSAVAVFKESEVGGPAPRAGRREVHREVEASQVNSFLDALARSDFWRARNDDEEVGIHGAIWTCEAVSGGTYKVTFRWSPREGPYRDAMLRLVALAGFRVPNVY